MPAAPASAGSIAPVEHLVNVFNAKASMKLEHNTRIAASPERVSAFLEDVPAVVRCLPYVESVREIAPDLYEGSARLKIGFVRLESRGQVRVVHGSDGTWRLEGEGRDGRGNPIGKGEVEARVKADS